MHVDYFTCPSCSHMDGKCKIWPFEEGQLDECGTDTNEGRRVRRLYVVYDFRH